MKFCKNPDENEILKMSYFCILRTRPFVMMNNLENKAFIQP